MRRVSLPFEGVALFHTEPVLFVHDDEREFVECHRVGKQRVSADDESGRAAGNRELSPLLLCRRQAADQECRIQPLGEITQSGHDRARVLRRQNFRRSDQRCLPAILDCGEHRANCDERLPRADLSLNQTIHRSSASHVLVDLGAHRRLVGRQFEWQRRIELRTQSPRCSGHRHRFGSTKPVSQ